MMMSRGSGDGDHDEDDDDGADDEYDDGGGGDDDGDDDDDDDADDNDNENDDDGVDDGGGDDDYDGKDDDDDEDGDDDDYDGDEYDDDDDGDDADNDVDVGGEDDNDTDDNGDDDDDVHSASDDIGHYYNKFWGSEQITNATYSSSPRCNPCNLQSAHTAPSAERFWQKYGAAGQEEVQSVPATAHRHRWVDHMPLVIEGLGLLSNSLVPPPRILQFHKFSLTFLHYFMFSPLIHWWCFQSSCLHQLIFRFFPFASSAFLPCWSLVFAFPDHSLLSVTSW